MIDTNSFFSIEDKKDDKNLISTFKEECMGVYTCDGDFTEEQCLENGSTIEFS